VRQCHFTDAGYYAHYYRQKDGVFRKGSLCMCGARVLDMWVKARASWLSCFGGWDALL
jgi:hypothetical protein